MSTQTLDRLVKGAPITPHPSSSTSAAAALASADANSSRLAALKPPRPPAPAHPTDPTTLLPSSPPQIYLNLLILEASLRAQYLTLRARRRQHTLVLALLAGWIAYFSYLLFLRPREDGRGVGGSVYWLVDVAEKVALMGGLLTLILFWATGQWERGVRWPRRWVAYANRGLRSMNCKVVVIRGPWWKEILGQLAFLVAFFTGGGGAGSSYHFVESSVAGGSGLPEKGSGRSSFRSAAAAAEAGLPRHTIIRGGHEYTEEDIAPGGDHVKLLLLSKPFSPDFRENWEIYRTEYWERENERRAALRRRVRERQRALAKQQGGWLWWTGWRGWARLRGPAETDVEMSHHHHHMHHQPYAAAPAAGHRRTDSMLKADKRRRPSVLRRDRDRDRSRSRSSSRSTTPTPDVEDRAGARLDDRARRFSNGSTSTTAGSATEQRRRSKRISAAAAAAAAAAGGGGAGASARGARVMAPVAGSGLSGGDGEGRGGRRVNDVKMEEDGEGDEMMMRKDAEGESERRRLEGVVVKREEDVDVD